MNKAQFEQQDKLEIWKYTDSIVIHVHVFNSAWMKRQLL